MNLREPAIVERPRFEWSVSQFRDVTLKQADHFDGWTTQVAGVWPLGERSQVRLAWPLYTSGDACITDIVPEQCELIGTPTHIRGNGGVFEYLTATYERQTRYASRDGFERAWFAGLGSRPDYLDTSHADRYNHQGKLFRYGVRSARDARGGADRLVTQAGLTWYFMSDDLNPSGGNDNFIHVDVLGAYQWRPWKARVQPFLEGGYRGDLSEYHDVFAAPGLSVRIGAKTFLTLAAQIGLSDDAPGPNYTLRLSR